MPPLLAAFCFLPLLLMLSSVFWPLWLHLYLIVALHGHQLMQAVAFLTVIVVALVFLRNDTYERVQTVLCGSRNQLTAYGFVRLSSDVLPCTVWILRRSKSIQPQCPGKVGKQTILSSVSISGL